jgi:putative transposase
MNQAKVTDLDYITFLVASPLVFSCTEAARVQPDQPRRAAPAALTRLLHRLDPDPAPLWDEAKQHVSLHHGLLLIDDTTLDKPYAQQIALVHRHWSGKHHHVVSGINLVTLLWSDGTDAIACAYRLYDKPVDGVTKNEHFRAMLQTAKERDFHPRFVAFDSWYSSLENLKTVRSLDWHWLTRLKSNRQVNPDGSDNRAVRECDISADGTVVHWKGYGMICVFRIVTPDGDTEYWATDVVKMTPQERERVAGKVWTIEVYHRGLKQFCGVERCQARGARAQRNHIGWAVRAFLRLEHHRIMSGTSWFEAKMGIIRSALKLYLSQTSPILVGLVQSLSTA